MDDETTSTTPLTPAPSRAKRKKASGPAASTLQEFAALINGAVSGPDDRAWPWKTR